MNKRTCRKEHVEKVNDVNNPSIRIYVNKVEKKIRFKTRYYFEFLMPETMK